MSVRTFILAGTLASAAALGACANSGGPLLATGSVGADAAARAAAPVDPACVTLTSQIQTLRKEGTPDRIEEVAAGKTGSSEIVRVKRTSLQKVAELNAANAQFQAKCSTLTPAQRAAVATQAAVGTAPTAATTAATSAATSAATAQASAVVAKTAAKAAQ